MGKILGDRDAGKNVVVQVENIISWKKLWGAPKIKRYTIQSFRKMKIFNEIGNVYAHKILNDCLFAEVIVTIIIKHNIECLEN